MMSHKRTFNFSLPKYKKDDAKISEQTKSKTFCKKFGCLIERVNLFVVDKAKSLN